MEPLYIVYLNALDIEALALSDDEILAAIEASLAAQGRKETVIEPRVHLVPDVSVHGHFNVLRGSFRAPINLAGVKVISDYLEKRPRLSRLASTRRAGKPVNHINRLRGSNLLPNTTPELCNGMFLISIFVT